MDNLWQDKDAVAGVLVTHRKRVYESCYLGSGKPDINRLIEYAELLEICVSKGYSKDLGFGFGLRKKMNLDRWQENRRFRNLWGSLLDEYGEPL